MAPKRRESKKPAKYEDNGDVSSDPDEFVSDMSDDEKPKKKRKTPKKPAASAKKAKKEANTEPETTEDGWTMQPPSLLHRSLSSESGSRIAAFDLDGTLALQKSSLQQPKDADDWVLYNKKVPEKLRELQSEGYKIVVFSNQGGIKSALKGKMAEKITKRVSNIIEAIGLELPVLLATNKDKFRKPESGMWDFFVEHGNKGVEPDKSQSFFVGDAAGGPDDFSDSDRKFAEGVGIDFKTSKEFFGDPDGKLKANTSGGSSGQNDEMANAFRDLAAASEAEGGNAFAARAYVKAAGIIASYPSKITAGKQISSLQGIGKGTVAKIDEFLATGTLAGVKKDPKAEEEKAAQAEEALKFV